MRASSLFTLLCLLYLHGAVAAQTKTSSYSSVEEKSCRTIKSTDEEGGSYEASCRGVAGYKLIIEEGDLRTNVKVVAPGGATHSLDLWSVVSSGFSNLGPRVEWRLVRRGKTLVPIAIIVRYNANENPENPNKITSYLAVAKITATQICVTSKILPGAKANEDARRAADIAETQPCLKP